MTKMNKTYLPKYRIDADIAKKMVRIGELTSDIRSVTAYHSALKLRRTSNIRSIHSSLAIEGNELSLEKMTDIIDGKRVLGDFEEIQEVKNAYEAYEAARTSNPHSLDDLIKIHSLMIFGLVPEEGVRTCKVAVFEEDTPIHIAPEPELVIPMLTELMQWLENTDEHPLIASAVFHYQLEFIHPFTDGNGRIGRLWHSLILSDWNDLFLRIPLEPRIRKEQDRYYNTIESCNENHDCTEFIRYCLGIIICALEEVVKISGDDNMSVLLTAMGDEPASAEEIMKTLKLSHKTNFRKNYLIPALEKGLIEMTRPDSPRSPKQRYRRI